MQRCQRWAFFVLSVLSASSAYAGREADKLLGLISVPALLAAFAGSGLILSFMPPSPGTGAGANFKLFGTIAFCSLLGAFFAPPSVRVIASYLEAFPGAGADLASAFLVGAIAQAFTPIVIERRGDLLSRFFPTAKRGGH